MVIADLFIIDSIVSNFFYRHTVIEDPLHPGVLGKMIAWLENCNKSHPKCSHIQHPVVLPTRLLDLSSLPSQEDILHYKRDPRELFHSGSFRLVRTPKSQDCYAALSYCWGKGVPYKTTPENVGEHMNKGVLYERIPKTLKDAVFLTRLLGLRYLWADCLCIIQGDREDWNRESAQMGLVYSRAFITITAARAYDCDEGFLEPRSESKEVQKMLYADEKGPFELHFEYDDLQGSPSSTVAETDQPLRLYGVMYSIHLRGCNTDIS